MLHAFIPRQCLHVRQCDPVVECPHVSCSRSRALVRQKPPPLTSGDLSQLSVASVSCVILSGDGREREGESEGAERWGRENGQMPC